MKHIFVVHNNITCLAIYETVNKLIEQSEDIVILTYRDCQWPFATDNVHISNVSQIYKNLYVYSPKTIVGILKRVLYEMNLCRWLSKRIIKSNKYKLYIPAFTLNFCAYLAKNTNCSGYFFVEEGTMAYIASPFNHTSINNIKQKIKRLFRIYDLFCLEVLDNFIGTISISNKAFGWNTKLKIVNKRYGVDKLTDFIPVDNVIVTGHMSDSMTILREKINILVDYLRQKKIYEIAIKFHPTVYFSFPKKIDEFVNYIQEIKDITFSILSQNYIVEYALLQTKCNVYSFETFSSLNLYSVMFGGKSYLLDGKKIIEFLTVENCINWYQK